MRPAVLLAACLVLATAAPALHAQSLPRPAEFYFDADALAVRPFVEAGAPPSIERLTRIVERKPESIVERGQLAQLAMRGGNVRVGRELYAAAIARVGESNAHYRRLLWNYGWDLHRSGDAAGALAQWQALAASRGGSRAAWLPPTLAMSLMANGRRDEAVQWYAAAVRTEPAQWRATAQHARLLPDWSEADRALLAQVHAAWVANPPRWP